jgi:hypothetical protein
VPAISSRESKTRRATVVRVLVAEWKVAHVNTRWAIDALGQKKYLQQAPMEARERYVHTGRVPLCLHVSNIFGRRARVRQNIGSVPYFGMLLRISLLEACPIWHATNS